MTCNLFNFRQMPLLSCSTKLHDCNSILPFGSKAPTGAVNQRKNIFFIRYHTIGYRFMLLQPITVQFSKSTLKPSAYTLIFIYIHISALTL